MLSSLIFWPLPEKVQCSANPMESPGQWSLDPEAGALLPESAQAMLRLEMGVSPGEEALPGVTRVLAIHEAGLASQSYRLEMDDTRVCLYASEPAGFFYACVSLCQWLRAHRLQGLPLTAVAITDTPAFRERGIMLDVSRNKVPSMATLYALIDLLAALKINQLQLYTEHSFAYAGHEAVWQHASPLTGAEIRQLDNYCAARFMELVPNQNSFGHFHRWLVLPAYRPLAECPEGIDHPFSTEKEPFSLCATDEGAVHLLADLYDQLLPNFHSRRFNVGLDETFDLGEGRSAAACAQRGKTQVYLDFLNKVQQLVEARDHQMMFWGDIIINSPEHLKLLPQNVLALEWGYEANHPFAENCKALQESGRAFYVCPGTSSWNCFAGRLDNALGNLQNAAHSGLANGALGYLITDWGDRGHLQPLPVSYPGFLAGAALSWNPQQQVDADLIPQALNLHVWQEPATALGESLVLLGNLYQLCGGTPHNGSPLFFLWCFINETMDFERVRGVNLAGLARVDEQLAVIRQKLDSLQAGGAEVRCALAEMYWLYAMLAWCVRLGSARLALGVNSAVSELDAQLRQQLADELTQLQQQRECLWMGRNRGGGWALSAAMFERTRNFLTDKEPS